MPLPIEDDETARPVAELRGTAKPGAIKASVQAELGRVGLVPRFAALRAAYPLPAPTGQAADKAFSDDLSGSLWRSSWTHWP